MAALLATQLTTLDRQPPRNGVTFFVGNGHYSRALETNHVNVVHLEGGAALIRVLCFECSLPPTLPGVADGVQAGCNVTP